MTEQSDCDTIYVEDFMEDVRKRVEKHPKCGKCYYKRMCGMIEPDEICFKLEQPSREIDIGESVNNGGQDRLLSYRTDSHFKLPRTWDDAVDNMALKIQEIAVKEDGIITTHEIVDVIDEYSELLFKEWLDENFQKTFIGKQFDIYFDMCRDKNTDETFVEFVLKEFIKQRLKLKVMQ